MYLRSMRLIAAVAVCLGLGNSASVFGYQSSPPLFFTPEANSVPEVLAAINGAHTSLHMTMFHLSDSAIIDALIAAQNRGVDVRVLLDQSQTSKEKDTGAFHRLSAANVKVTKSSQGFSITHEKAFVVDGDTAYIMTLNLTRINSVARDVAYITTEPDTVRFVDALFALDVKNASTQGIESPTNVPDNIVLSPGARARLESFINSAHESIKLEVENFSDQALMDALIKAHKSGVNVQVLLPRCDLTANDFDMPAARQLSAAGVDVRMMPSPMTADVPYIHQKSIVVDEETAFLGSENFSFNSLEKARELGIIINEMDKVEQMVNIYDSDFNKGLNMADSEAFNCPAKPFGDSEIEF